MNREMDDMTVIYESLKAWILQLPVVGEAPHRFGGAEFQVEGVEFMHSHGHSWLDIRLSREDQASVLKTGECLLTDSLPKLDGLASDSMGPIISTTLAGSYI
jgi:hypothetical protein